MFLLFFCSFLKFNTNVDGFVIEALHDHMSDSELGYYFQNRDRFHVPEYEIVYLPTIIPAREADRYEAEETEDETIHYNFSAFKQ